MPSVVVCLLVVATVAIGQDDPKLQRSPEIRESILDTFFLKRDGNFQIAIYPSNDKKR